MPKNIPRTGKRLRPKTAVKGKRYLCAKCRKRSPRLAKTVRYWPLPKRHTPFGRPMMRSRVR